MKAIVTILLFLVILNIGCKQPINKSQLLTQHLKEMLNDDYKSNGNYIVINKRGCMGCISKSIVFLIDNPNYLKQYDAIIASQSIVNEFSYITTVKLPIYIDSVNKLEYLNTGVVGFSVVSLKSDDVSKLTNSNVLITADNSKMDTFFTTGNNYNTSTSTFIELFRNDFEKKFPIKELDSNKLNRETLIFFTSDYCAPCKIVFPIIDSLSTLYSDSIDFYFIKSNKKDNSKIFHDYNVFATPTIVIFKRNHQTIQKIGLQDKNEIIKYLFEE